VKKLRTPRAAEQQVHHHGPQLGIDQHTARTRAREAFGRGPVGNAGQIAAAVIDAAPQLPAHRGRGTTQLARDLAHGAILALQIGDHIRLSNDKYQGCRLGGVRMRTGG